MSTSLRRHLLHVATDLSALVENPGNLHHAFDLLTRSYSTPAADAARAALRADAAIAPLIAERYWGRWPSAGSRAGIARCPSGAISSASARSWRDARSDHGPRSSALMMWIQAKAQEPRR